MLLVFAMSAIIGIMLYQQLPRVAFEAQREKEALVINHGEQYKRAVQLYCRKMGRYPAKMDDLDNTQNVRFLRKHYIDPLTGKEEWRLLHMGPNGKLVDSKIEAPDANKDKWREGSITEFHSANSSSDSGNEAVNIAARKRHSDDHELGPMGGNPSTPPQPSEPAALTLSSSSNPAPGNSDPSAIPGAPPQTPPVPGATWTPPNMPASMRGYTPPAGNSQIPPGANPAAFAGGGQCWRRLCFRQWRL
jgi:hypothetical protein